jgi:hypothetical protein
MKKTAIECIIEKIQKRIDRQSPYIEKYNTPDCRLYLYKILEECMEALEIEKEQIINAHGIKEKKSSGISNYIYKYTGEEYYNETFKTE